LGKHHINLVLKIYQNFQFDPKILKSNNRLSLPILRNNAFLFKKNNNNNSITFFLELEVILSLSHLCIKRKIKIERTIIWKFSSA